MKTANGEAKWIVRAVVLIAALLTVVYLRALDNPLLESERVVLVEGVDLRGPGSAVKLFLSPPAALGTPTDVYAPLTALSLATDRMLWGPRAESWRMTALCLHGVSALLLFLILLRIGVRGTWALLVTLLFALHPVHTQAINMISSRGHILSGAFTLAAVLLFTRTLGAETRSWGRSRVPAAAWCALALFLAGLLAGREALAFPLVCLFWPWAWGRRYPHWTFYVGLVGALAVFAIMGAVARGALGLDGALWGGAGILNGLRLVVAPFGQMIYHPVVIFWSWADGRFLAGLGVVIALVLVSVLLRGRRPAVAMTLGFCFCTLMAGFLVLARGGALAEPGLYLVAAAACASLGAVLDSAAEVPFLRPALLGLVALLVAAAGLKSSARCAVWSDAEKVWLEVLETSPGDQWARGKLAAHYRMVGHSEKAAELVSPQEGDSLSVAVQINNEGVALMDSGRLLEAAEKFRDAIEAWPDFGDAHFNLGVVLHALGQPDSAEASFRRTLEVDPSYANAHYNLGIIYDRAGDLDRAQAEYEDAVRLDPMHARAWANLGALQGKRDRFQEAIPLLERALELDPGLLQARSSLAFAYEKVDVERAKEQWRIYLDLARARGVNPARIAQVQRRLEEL